MLRSVCGGGDGTRTGAHKINAGIPLDNCQGELPSWVIYDQNFRQEAADSGRKDWSKVDPSIYTQCLTNAARSSVSLCKVCQSIDNGLETVKPEH